VKFVTNNIQWVMLIAGITTATMLLALIAPSTTLNMMFGDDLTGPLAQIVVRNWGLLIGVVGLMLIYAAVQPTLRRFVIVVATVTKLAFISLILIYGQAYLAKALASIVFDAAIIILFALYLMSERDPT